MTKFLWIFFILTALLVSAADGQSRRSSRRRSRRSRPVIKQTFVKAVTAVGKLTCDGEPLPNVQLRILDSIPFRRDKTLAYTRTDEDGNFNVTSKAREPKSKRKFKLKKYIQHLITRTPRPYIRVHYTNWNVNGSLKVISSIRRYNNGRSRVFVRSQRTKVVRSDNDVADFGTINFTNIHCQAYVRFSAALQLFNMRAPTIALPYRTLFVRTKAHSLQRSGPLALFNSIVLPKLFQNITTEIANHEFAHTFRQSFDSPRNFTHFKEDAANFNYTLRTACGNKTNEGNAFNEGWASYWAEGCNGSFGNDTQDFTIEGNVANALRDLQSNCTSTFSQMVNVLKQNQLIIHSFQSFNEQHGALYNCTLSS